ncbi:MAG: hypothetical protein PHN57_07085 [Candidatus Omnitrophica bacterium]|nr:hypothetical protein [Candidatus Omnitrophota bacterium]
MNKLKPLNSKLIALSLNFALCALSFTLISQLCYAQDKDLEFNLDAASNTISLPKIFKPNIDLSGRGFHAEQTWPQELAAQEVVDDWFKEIGGAGIYRLQYNLWEISQLSKDKPAQEKLLANYESVIKRVNDAGGIVILDIFSTPPGLGKVLDKKSTPLDLRAFKEVVKKHIRELSCNKKYNIWYEIWSAPDSDDFFLGRKQEYLNLYRAIAEGVKELENETKIHIPVGGPGASWWFQNFDGNTIITPEKSLIYELIKFCHQYRLPLDFISWHAYSTDPNVEKEATSYNKNAILLIRDWLTYFNFNKETPLVLTEWNYDSGNNVLSERKETSFVCASYIPSRIKNMFEAGLDYQIYFSLEDFQGNKEGVMRNVGIFWFEQDAPQYKGGHKSIYNVFKMLGKLGNSMYYPQPKINDEFVDVTATKSDDYTAILISNYIDSDISTNYLTRNIATLNKAERQVMLDLLNQDTLEKFMRKELDFSHLRSYNKFPKVRTILKHAQELNDSATKYMFAGRNIKINIKNLNNSGKTPEQAKQELKQETKQEQGAATAAAAGETYLYERYTVDSSCSMNCVFVPVEEKEVNVYDSFQQTLTLNPYSVNLIILKKKPKEAEPVPAAVTASSPENAQVSPATGEPAAKAQQKEAVPGSLPVAANSDKSQGVSAPTGEQQKDNRVEVKTADPGSPENKQNTGAVKNKE